MYIEKYDARFIPIKARTGSSFEVEFYTEIQAAEAGDEERISLRQQPEITVNYSYAYFQKDFDKVNSEFINNLRDKWIIPFWYFKRDVVGTFVDSSEYLVWINDYMQDYNLSSDPFYPFDKVLFYKNENDFFFCDILRMYYSYDITTGNGTILKIPHDMEGVNLNGYRAYPVVIGYILGDVSVETNKRYCTTEVSYAVTSMIDINELQPTRLFNGLDVYEKCLLLEGDNLPITYIQDQIISSNTLGIKDYRTNFDHSYRSHSLRRVISSRKECWEFIMWCMRRLGQYRPFYMPTYTTDFEVVSTNLIGFTAIGADPSITTFAVLKDGGFKLYQATDVVVNGELVTYEIEDFEFDEDSQLCYALIYRFNTDTVQLMHNDNRGLVDVSVNIRSIR